MSQRRGLVRCSLLAVLAVLALVVAAPGRAVADSAPGERLADLADRAATGDLVAARALREAGPAGLSALVDAGVAEPGRRTQNGYRQALDLVCAQVGCASSQLYWYTDLEAARREAERTGRPILSLRLLGRLDEELSCANSRFFRLVLYSDPEISGWLRDHAVLYWSSERPVPQVTVDYGDGRRLVGTLTGNSIHYLLDSHGRLVDALPGLNAPHRFLAWLREGGERAAAWASLDDDAFVTALRSEHQRAARAILDELVRELVDHGWSETAARKAWGASPVEEPTAAPTAAEAAARAVSKGVAEAPTLTAIGSPPQLPPGSNAILALMLSPAWSAHLSAPSRELLESQAPEAALADLEGARIRLGNRLSEDGLRNEAYLHRSIHAYLTWEGSTDWLALNSWVYERVFLTPASDPWLGLSPTELLTALRPADGGAGTR
jgi:hypothetical protein